jgi:glycosyltransferase involved in cell wall biosynthesis
MQALSDALPFEDAPTLDRAAVVLQLGPALSVRGGISAVEKIIVAQMGSSVAIRHIATTEEGSPLHKLRVFLRAIRTLRVALREHDRVVAHIHFASRGSALRKAILAWITLRSGKPLILHAHGGYFNEFFARLPGLLQRSLRRIFERADCFLVLSTQWQDFYTRQLGVPARRVRILRNPTSLPKTIPSRAGRDRVQFLFLGRIGENKGALLILKAFGALPAELRARSRLVFAGDGEVARLRALANDYPGAVDVYSWVDSEQRDALLSASDVFVLPSYQEGLPMALLEAMAAGLPVITTPVGGIPDVVTDGIEGLLIKPGDVAALCGAMSAMIEQESLRLQLGKRGRLRAEDFDVNHFAAELREIYRGLLQ